MEKFILDFGNISFDSTLKLSEYSFNSSVGNRSSNSSSNKATSRNHQCLPSEDEDDGPILGKYMNGKAHRLKYMEKSIKDNTSDDEDNQVLGLRLSKIKQQQQQQKKNERRGGHMKRNSLYAAPPLVSLNSTEKAEPKRMSISGMDLLKQLEQRKADAKRQKPKIDPSQAKIQGLLSRLPEPGLHTISFQQKNFQNKARKHRSS
ncbi:hypothetical protein K501DRAFT_328947 [Backusella circina FSU 941]|nr:hypothetical protein K501DRAFT_328947 [Backusella circina FSU 941]